MAADSVGQIGLDLVVNKNDFEQQMNGIQSLAKKAGALLPGAFAVKKLIDFGKSALSLVLICQRSERGGCNIPAHV